MCVDHPREIVSLVLLVTLGQCFINLKSHPQPLPKKLRRWLKSHEKMLNVTNRQEMQVKTTVRCHLIP